MEDVKKVGRPAKSNEAFNPLRAEKVIVRLIKKHRGFVSDSKSPFYGGLAPNSEIKLVVPRLRNGELKNVLTNNEKEFFEKTLGLPENALSVYKNENNYWVTSTPNCINSVRLTKRDSILDLSKPADYIRYKILLANEDIICPNMSEQNNKNTYMFVLINDKQEATTLNKKVDMKLEVYTTFQKYSDNADKLRALCYLGDGKKTAKTTGIELLKAKMMDIIESNITRAASIFNDPLLDQKMLIYNAVEKGILAERNGIYYNKETGNPLCREYEVANLSTSASYLADVANQELMFNIQKRTY